MRVENGLNRKYFGRFAERDISDKTGCTVNPTFGCLKFYHGDHLGSSTLVTSAAGAVVHRQAYKPYGEDLVSPAPGAFTPTYQFTFKEKEADGSGFYDFGARLYNPAIGRFLSADDSTDDGLNRYAYVRNNPLHYVDPTGHGSQNPSWWDAFLEWGSSCQLGSVLGPCGPGSGMNKLITAGRSLHDTFAGMIHGAAPGALPDYYPMGAFRGERGIYAITTGITFGAQFLDGVGEAFLLNKVLGASVLRTGTFTEEQTISALTQAVHVGKGLKGWKGNCTNLAVALYHTLEGRPTSAIPWVKETKGAAFIETLNELGLKPTWGGRAELEAALAKEGGHAIVVGNNIKDGGAHAYNVLSTKSGLLAVDYRIAEDGSRVITSTPLAQYEYTVGFFAVAPK
jgi:RHS repeat-associated protein